LRSITLVTCLLGTTHLGRSKLEPDRFPCPTRASHNGDFIAERKVLVVGGADGNASSR